MIATSKTAREHTPNNWPRRGEGDPMNASTDENRTAEQAARLDRIRQLARAQLDQGEDGEVMEALVLLAHLRPCRGEEALWALKVIARDMARELGDKRGEPVYPCHDWTGELLCLICGYLEEEGWAYDYVDTRRWLRSEDLMARYDARKAAETAYPPTD